MICSKQCGELVAELCLDLESMIVGTKEEQDGPGAELTGKTQWVLSLGGQP